MVLTLLAPKAEPKDPVYTQSSSTRSSICMLPSGSKRHFAGETCPGHESGGQVWTAQGYLQRSRGIPQDMLRTATDLSKHLKAVKSIIRGLGLCLQIPKPLLPATRAACRSASPASRELGLQGLPFGSQRGKMGQKKVKKVPCLGFPFCVAVKEGYLS